MFDIPGFLILFLLWVFYFLQFQPVMVKKDGDKRENKKSEKVVTNGSGNGNPNSVGSVESSSAAATPQSSA